MTQPSETLLAYMVMGMPAIVVGEAISNLAAPERPDDFMLWVRPHVAAMTRLAARLGSPGNQDDIVQDALVRAWLKRHQFRPGRGSPSAWLLAITADQARRMRRSVVRPLTRQVRGSSPEIEERLDLEGAIAKLSSRQRLAVDC
jgi:DNA-directed RNA polymerase specialized sigma24 family protein